ncbi:hypothetical protein Glove_192g12 [Diversispora epigaea]|uniref:mannose-1-phosphate guanylyltransferase n=1 Tax=Diversispora epigaea TaxID=1348612 RepID=A0A397ISR6_9GLOM|nr:hypothetical protein Glove_192g12 [Diversispora epigaea]
MKALILVGGFGTRLRPLTLTLPKPLVEFCNKPMILHQIEGLVKAGVTDIVLAVNYRPEIMVDLLKNYEEKYKVKITFSVETEPLGTAGPLALAKEILAKDKSPFFVLNSDIICEFPFEQLRDFHGAHKNEGTIVVTKVNEPSKYGVIVNRRDSTLIERFVEKPAEFVSNKINAGIYIFTPDILDRIELKPTSIEKEIFPKMATDSQLHAFDLEGFWMDVGQPKDFLTGTVLYLSNLSKKQPQLLANSTIDNYVCGGNVLVDPTAKIGKDCRIGPNVTIGPNVIIGNGVRLQRCVILEGVRVKDFAWVKNSIIGWHSTLGRWTRLEGVSVLGDDVAVNDEIYVNGGCILPHKCIATNITEPQIIM